LCVLAPIGAVETRIWEQADQADFEKGQLTKLSLSSEGHLTPAPLLKDVHDPAVTFLWAIARNSKGTIYAGGGTVGGSKCRLIEVEQPSGKARAVAELDGMAIQAIVIDKQDHIYAATSPDGKVYRVDPTGAGKADVFYDPKTKYIWALAVGKNGELFVATGDEGEIHRVMPNGTGSVFYKTEEAHVRSMTVDAAGNLIVGTDPSGLILRVSTDGAQGQGFVLYEAPKREITAIAVGADGMIYASGTGNKQPAAAPAAPGVPAGRAGAAAAAQPAQPAGRGGAPPATAPGNPPAAVAGGSELYRIQPDGYARKIWAHAQDVIYAMTFDTQRHLIAGTGNRGFIYRIDDDHTYTRLLDVSPSQVTGFAAAPDGKLYFSTGNIGGIFSLGPEREASGTFESDVLDAAAFSYWGRVTSLIANGAANSVGIETRSGNTSRPQKDWSPWAKLDASGRVASPAARFLQYRATINGNSELYDVSAAYEMKNVAPVIDAIETTPANYRTPGAAAGPPPANPLSLTLPAIGRRPAAAAASDGGNTPTVTWAKGQIGVRWAAGDENGDTLVFRVEIRGENETSWKLLKEVIRERYHSWDSTAFADGKYFVRITASDSPSNPPDQALSTSREGDRFLIDNSAPEITALTGTVSGAKIDVRFHAKDAWNTLDKAEYSVNGGEWKVVEPTTRLTDSEEHDYRFQVDRAQGEQTIAVRVTDAYANEATAKTIVR
jgi:sugar lactone lactonase YvrE